MQDIIVAKINGDVSNALDTSIILPIFVGEIDTVSALQVGAFHRLALYDLCARMHAEFDVRALIQRSASHE